MRQFAAAFALSLLAACAAAQHPGAWRPSRSGATSPPT